jgi:hypothetical protein
MVPTCLASVCVLLLSLAVGDSAGQQGATAHTYYVDATRGDDARDALSPAAAWRSLNRVNKAALQPGDRVLFRRGETWRGQLMPQSGSPAGAITYGVFGRGDKPLLLGSLARDRAEDWQPAGPGIWATAPIRSDRREVSADPAPLSVDVGNIILNHGAAVGIKKWSTADLRQEGDYYYDGRRRQVVLRSAANPAARHRSIELALNRHIIDEGGRGYVTYENLALRYGAAHGIGGGSTQHITVRDCDISYIGGGHQFTTPAGNPVRFGNGVEFWAGARDCLVEGCRLWEIYDAALTNQGSGTNVQENITYRHNVIWNSEYSFEYWNGDQTSKTRNIRFEHNTCVNAGFGWGHNQRPDPNGRHLMFYSNTAATEAVSVCDNIFCNATDSGLRLLGRDWTAALTMDRNDWFQSRGPILLWNKMQQIGPEQFDAFRRLHGIDAHSIVADPKFLAPDRNDYRLAPDSPARAIEPQGPPVGALP